MRIPPTRQIGFGLLCGWSILLAGCGDPSLPMGPLVITATPASVSVGGSVALHATLKFSHGPAQDVTANTQWTVSNPALATVTNALLTATAPGTVMVSGSYTAPASSAGQVEVSKESSSSSSLSSSNLTSSAQVVILPAPPVAPAIPVLTWAAPSPIQYGTALSNTQLSATANVPGTFVYTPAAGTVLSAGSRTLTAAFTPADPSAYAPASAGVPLTVTQAKPIITWPAPAGIQQGTALGSAELNATANVPGSFVYSPPAGTVLNAGTQPLTATFTPADTVDYASATAANSLTVNSAAAAATLTSIQIATSASLVKVGATLQLSATGTYSDKSTKNLTSTAAWQSSSASLATVSGGLVSGVAAGTVQITAGSGGVTSAPFSVTVSSGNVDAIDCSSMSQTAIQNAINNSSAGDTIAFAAGTCTIASPGLYLAAGRTYTGSTNGTTLLQGSGGYPLMLFSGSGLTVQNFTFDSGGLYLGGAVSGVNVEYNTFQNIPFGPNAQTEYGNWTSTVGVFMDTSAANSDISHNQFKNLSSQILDQMVDWNLGVTGIFGYGLSNVTITYNTFDTINEGIHIFFDSLDGENVHINNNTFTHTHRIAIELQDSHAGGLEVAGNSVSSPLNGWALTFGMSIASTSTTGTGQSVHDNVVNANAAVASNCTGPGCYFPYGIEAFGTGTTVLHNTIEGNWGIGVGVGQSTNLLIENNAICGPNMAANNTYVSDENVYTQAGLTVLNNTESAGMTCGVTTAGSIAAAGSASSLNAPARQVGNSAGSGIAGSAVGMVAPALLSVAIMPAQPSVSIGGAVQLKAVAAFTDGSTKDVTANFGWISADPRTLGVSASGLLTGVADGQAAVSGSYLGLTASTRAASAIGEMPWSAPIVITQGGTYSGNWQSADPKTPAVTVATTDPVILENSHIRSAANLISAHLQGANLTVRNTVGIALNANVKGQANGVFVDAVAPARLDVENCYVENAQSGVLVHGYAGNRDGNQTILVRANRARNLSGLLSDGNGGYLPGEGADRSPSHFLQLDTVSSVPGIDVGWNEVIDYPGQSLVSDVIEMYRASGTPNQPIEVHDSYIQGAFPYQPATDAFSGGGIETGGGADDTAQNASAYNAIHDNQVVGTVNYGIQFAAGHDNVAFNNRAVSSGLLPNGAHVAAQNAGISDFDLYGTNLGDGSMYNNTMYDNTIGWMCWTAACAEQGYRNDEYLPLAPADGSSNVPIPAQPITLDMENAEYQRWLGKIAAAGITVGPAF